MANDILIRPTASKIEFSGSAHSSIRLEVQDSGSVVFQGSSGSLFGITDSMSGSLFSVNDISGLPIMEVFSDDKITLGRYQSPIIIDQSGSISGSLTSTASFGKYEGITSFAGAAGTETTFSGSSTSTASFGKINIVDSIGKLSRITSSFTVDTGPGNATITGRSYSQFKLEWKNQTNNVVYSDHYMKGTGHILGLHYGGSHNILQLHESNISRHQWSTTNYLATHDAFEYSSSRTSIHKLGAISASGDITLDGSGSLSGSITSTGSFGALHIGLDGVNKKSSFQVGLAAGEFAHFGDVASTSHTNPVGITFGYREVNNTSYRKVGIAGKQIGDFAARGELHLLVDSVADGGSVGIEDSKLMIEPSGSVTIQSGSLLVTAANTKISGSITSTGSFGAVGILTSTPDAELYVKGGAASGDITATTGTNKGIIHIDGGTANTSKYMITFGNQSADATSNPIGVMGVHNNHSAGSGLFFGLSTSYSSGVNRIPFVINAQSADGLLQLAGNKISGSLTSTGSFGALNIDGGHFTSASLAAGGGGGGGQATDTTDTVTFAGITSTGDIRANGDIIASQYIVSSSITHTTQSFSSGSTIFGDTIDDTHEFTGSVDITGSLTLVGGLEDLDRLGINGLANHTGVGIAVHDKTIVLKQSSGNDSGTALVFSEAALSDNSFVIAHDGSGSGRNNILKFKSYGNATAMELYRDKALVIHGNVTGSGNISGSLTGTGSFGRIQAGPGGSKISGSSISLAGAQVDVLSLNSVNSGAGGGGALRFITTQNNNTLGRISVVDESGYAAGFSFQTNRTGGESDTTIEMMRLSKTGHLFLQGGVSVSGSSGGFSGSLASTGSFGALVLGGQATLFANSDDLRFNKNFGIGINPDSNLNGTFLHIKDAANAHLKLEVNGPYASGLWYNNSSAMLVFYNDYQNATNYGGFAWRVAGGDGNDGGTTEIMRLRGSRLGIMNDSPPKTLTVGGDISGSGDIDVVGDINLTGTGSISGSIVSTGSFGEGYFSQGIRLGINGNNQALSNFTSFASENSSHNTMIIKSATGDVTLATYHGSEQWYLQNDSSPKGFFFKYNGDGVSGYPTWMMATGSTLNVGIGMTDLDDTNKLQVGGNALVTGSLTVNGIISGSITSTGSFGSITTTAVQNDLYIQGGSTTKLKIRPSINTGVSELHFSRYNRDNAGYISYNHTADRMDIYAAGPSQRVYINSSGVGINNALTVGTSITAGGNISSSLTSTGSFGKLIGDGSSLTNLPASSAFPYNSTTRADVTGSMHISSSVGTATASLVVEGSGSEVFTVKGTNGTLFSVSDELSGSLFAVTNVAGLPIVEAFSNNKVNLGPFSKPVGVTDSGSLTVSGSMTGVVVSMSIASYTASMDARLSNFFHLQLASGADTYLSASNISPGQSINLQVTQQATSGTISYSDQFKFPNGMPYAVSATGSGDYVVTDLVSFVSFDSQSLFGTALKNLT